MAYRNALRNINVDHVAAYCVLGGGVIGANMGGYSYAQDGDSYIFGAVAGGILGCAGGALFPLAIPVIVVGLPGYALSKLSDRRAQAQQLK